MNEEQLYAMRHSAAHVLATAIKRKWPEVKLGVGPVIENGFYYDIELPGDARISEDNFKGLEKEMKKIIAANEQFVHSTKPIDDAVAWAQESGQTYKEELLNDLSRAGTTVAKDLDERELGTIAEGDGEVSEVGFYTNGEFTDLCRGPHVESTGAIGAFKLMSVSGVYWRGKEDNPQMQRVQGVAFETQEKLDGYLQMLEEAKARDHRKLGKELDLFTFSPLVGSGLPLFTPRGTVLREKLNSYAQQLRSDNGYSRVSIPHITKPDLYKASGHWDKFGDELFLIESQETSDSFVLKPMNCPHHTQIFASQPRSYKELPLKFMETTMQYRDEKTGELHGLSRVRSISIDDTHVFVRPDQIEQVASELIDMVQEIYGELGLGLKFRLSFRDDSEAYLGETELWDKAQSIIENLAKANNLDYFIEPGEAAFYGPKIDFIAVDAIGREWQLSTVQVDFVQPQRFELEYIDQEGSSRSPVMLHYAILGSLERFLSVYIEHTNGWFPFWLAPEQIRILTINNEVGEYVEQITTKLKNIVLMSPLKYNELRYSVDDRNESLGKKIKTAQNLKVPVMMIVGPRDQEAGTVSVRTQDGEQSIKLDNLESFITVLK